MRRTDPRPAMTQQLPGNASHVTAVNSGSRRLLGDSIRILLATAAVGVCLWWRFDLVATLFSMPRTLLGSALTGLCIIGLIARGRMPATVTPVAPAMTQATRKKAMDTAPESPPRVEPSRSIGGENALVRALNFASGGFDTIMQLGVAQALLVIRGRAPDVVVGVSAGAVQAAALVEVLQAGNKDQGFAERQRERVKRLRSFIAECQDAPQRLIDSLLPDPYQTTAHAPLRPVNHNFLPDTERQHLRKSLLRKTGVIRLYNDILQLNISIGLITRFVRTYLGCKAAGDIRSPWRRQIAIAAEVSNSWLLLGSTLHRLVALARMAIVPVAPFASKQRFASAGELLFSFPLLSAAVSNADKFSTFMFLLSLWLSVSWMVLALFWTVASAIVPGFGSATTFISEAILTVALLLVALFAVAFVGNLEPTDSRARSALARAGKGLLLFALQLALWSIIFVAIVGAAVWLSTSVSTGNSSALWTRFDLTSIPKLAGIVLAAAALLAAPRMIAAWLAFRRERRAGTQPNATPQGFLSWYIGRFLRSYDLADSLAHPYELEQLLIRNFDPAYYGRPNAETSIAQTLSGVREGFKPNKPTAQTIRRFSAAGQPAIHMGVAAANVVTGNLEAVPDDTPIVDALLAATAMPPIFPVRRIGDCFFTDGSIISDSPTRVLMKLLRDHVHSATAEVHIFPVTALPLSSNKLPPRDGRGCQGNEPYLELWRIALRAMQLRRFRDARLEKRLTELYSLSLPPNCGVLELSDKERYFRANLTPIELDQRESLNQRVLWAKPHERQERIAQVIADGCRASLEAMIGPIDFPEQGAGASAGVGDAEKFVLCRHAVAQHLKTRASLIKNSGEKRKSDNEALLEPGLTDLPETGDEQSAPQEYPGLPEVCRHCRLIDPKSGKEIARQALRRVAREATSPAAPPWPLEAEFADGSHERRDPPAPHRCPPVKPGVALGRIESTDPVGKPAVSLLFSGGVFRGVFQLGVINALRELDTKPHLVAGSSVGSITAAMSIPALCDVDAEPIHRLAAVFLTLDRIVLTDRFADLVRRFTLRAAETRFTISQLDRLFRLYDHPGHHLFDKSAREVIAGIERLFYVTPYTLNEFVRAARHRETSRSWQLAGEQSQNWLSRMEVATEVLGAEPLEFLIRHYVLKGNARPNLKEFNVELMATMTDLSRGELKEHSVSDLGADSLVNALLASSAFPGVFRPRWSWEIEPEHHTDGQYIDGGVMDNLPIDSVIVKLRSWVEAEKFVARPRVPHLILAASLEVDLDRYGQEGKDPASWTWVELAKRAKRLAYNKKLDTYQDAQDAIRRIVDVPGRSPTGSSFTPLNVYILAVKPRWLCSTFGFHPMLGYRRELQARSIAHGCASTLVAMARVDRDWRAGWGINEEKMTDAIDLDELTDRTKRLGKHRRNGGCWLRPKCPCPFSEISLRKVGAEEGSMKAVSMIHRLCWERKSHAWKE